METYGSNRSSGAIAYAIVDEGIWVQFGRGARYLYSYDSAGWHHVERMKLLARRGAGLTRYINAHVSDRYAERADT